MAESKAKPTRATKAKPSIRKKSDTTKTIKAKVQRTNATISSPKARKRLYPVTINGRDRMITIPTYAALKKDPRYTIDLPDGSPLAQVEATGKIDETCKDC